MNEEAASKVTRPFEEALTIELGGLVAKLREERISEGLLPAELAERLGVGAGTVRKWENGDTWPTVAHLLDWCWKLNLRIVVVGPDGAVRYPRVERTAGEKRGDRELRRLALALRSERIAHGHSQQSLGERAGLTRVTINRLEAARSAAPNLFEFARWAAYLNCYFVLEPVSMARLGEDYGARTSKYALKQASKYSPAFRSEAVAYAAKNIPPRSMLSVATDLGISDFTLSKWIQRAHVDKSSPEASALRSMRNSL